MRRVVVTGMGGVTPLGQSWPEIEAALHAKTNAVRHIEAWDHIDLLHTKLGVPVADFAAPMHYPRKMLRSMGRVALLSVRATELALADAGVLEDPEIQNGDMGVAYGSSFGSVEPVKAFGRFLETGIMQGMASTGYIQVMSHTAAVNIALSFKLKGRIIPTVSACTSGSQAIGFAYEAIRFRRQNMMVAGGADELSPITAAVFDNLYATSQMNDTPHLTPRPFDRNRDGLVVGEGAATLVLEELEHARRRGAHIYAEVLGFGCNSDGSHVTQPAAKTMAVAMNLALQDAGLPSGAVGWVNAHGTATEYGDIAESKATLDVFKGPVPISSLKSYFGHTLGACGAIEAWVGIEMMRRGWIAPTINLEEVDPKCSELAYVRGDGQKLEMEYFMSNNFAFGGINTSLVFRRHS